MAKKSNIQQEITPPVGFNIYQDKKKRTIYKHPFLKKAVYIPIYDFKTFDLYRKRYILVISVFVVLFTLLSDWFGIPWWVTIFISLLIWIFMEFKFYKFLQNEQPVKHFTPKEYSGYYDNFEMQGTNKVLLKTVLYVAIGVLIVYNSYYSGYTGMYTLASWAVLGVCLVYAVFQLLVLLKVKKRQKARN